MYPSSRSTSAIPRQTRLLSTFTVLLLLRTALRMRVSMSAMRSVEGIVGSWVPFYRSRCVAVSLPRSLPTRLAHAGDLPLQRQLAEHDAADPELAVHAAGATRQLAPPHDAGAELRRAPALGHLGFGGHDFWSLAGAGAGAAAAAGSGAGLGCSLRGAR